MRIENLEFLAPSKLNPFGLLKFSVEIPVQYSEEMDSFSEKESDVILSEETTSLINKLKDSIIKDLKSV